MSGPQLLGFALCLLPALARADGKLYETSLKDPRRGKDQAIKLWIPEGVDVVRGAICQPNYAGLTERKDYQAFARDLGFALLGAALDRKGDMAHAVRTALKEFAAEARRPELEHLPIVASGFSAGGGMAIRLAYEMPERTIAVWSNGNPGVGMPIDRDPERLKAYAQIPTLTVNGSRDPFVDYDKAPERYWHRAHHPPIRAARLEWGLAMQWGKGHDYGATNDLAWPFVAEVVRLRLPADHDPRTGPPKLRPIPEEQGWLANIATWESNFAEIAPFDETRAKDPNWTWLPSKSIAWLWRGFVAHHPPARLEAALEPGDGAKLTLRLQGDLPENVRKVDFYRGDELIATTSAAPHQVATGAMSRTWDAAIAVLTLADGSQLATRPLLRIRAVAP